MLHADFRYKPGCFVLIHLFPEAIVKMFNDSPELIRLGTKALSTNTLAFPVIGIQIIFSNYFQYINKPKPSTFLSLSRQCLFLIPALLLLSNKFGLDGIFYAQPISDFLAAILSVIMVSISLRSLTKNSKNVSKEGN